jgi:hypothetical protein
MSINCHEVKRSSAGYIDGRLRFDERSGVAEHLTTCESCSSYFDQVVLIRTTMGQMSHPAVPAQLQTELKVIASRERAEVLRTRGSRVRVVWERWKFSLNELMRPLALPATGGLLSSIALFGLFVLTFGTTAATSSYDIPLCGMETSEATLVPIELRTHSVTLNMSFDSSGRIGDYNIANEGGGYNTAVQAHLAAITVPEFSTVFAVARPISGDIQIQFVPLALRQ